MSFTGISWYVAPNGSPRGDGSAARPWDLATAFAHPDAIEPGDVIWLVGGVYPVQAPLEARLTGTAEAPIQVWGDPAGEPAVLELEDGRPQALYLTGRFSWYGDFELRCTSLQRWSETPGSDGNPRGTAIFADTGPGVRLIRLRVRDFGTSMFESQPSGIEIMGCTFCNSYWDAPDRSHGPGLYVRNPRGAPRKRIVGNVVFQHGRQGLQGFGSTPFAEMDVLENVFFNNGVAGDGFHRNFMFGNAGDEHWNVRIENNVAYFPAGSPLGHEANMAGGDGGSHQLRLVGNWIAHEGRPALRVHRAEDAAIADNRIVGEVEYSNLDQSVTARDAEVAALFPDNEYFHGAERPSGMWIRRRQDPELPDAWRRYGEATVTVLNWDSADEAQVSLDDVAEGTAPAIGAQLWIRAVHSASPALKALYDGGLVRIPLTGWSEDRPLGRPDSAPLPPTLPELGVFRIRWSVDGASAPRDPVRLADPALGAAGAAADEVRRQAWTVADEGLRDQLRAQRRAYWRAQTLGRFL